MSTIRKITYRYDPAKHGFPATAGLSHGLKIGTGFPRRSQYLPQATWDKSQRMEWCFAARSAFRRSLGLPSVEPGRLSAKSAYDADQKALRAAWKRATEEHSRWEFLSNGDRYMKIEHC